MRRFSLKNQDQDMGCPLYLQIYSCYGRKAQQKYAKEITKEKEPKGPHAINTCFKQITNQAN